MTGEIVYSNGEKFLLVYNDDKSLVSKYDLTKMGLEHIDSYEEFKKLISASSYNYNCGTLNLINKWKKI